MPATNRSKVHQQQQLTMSKRVKQLVNYSDLSAQSKAKVDPQLSSASAPVKSSRSRAGVILTDEMLLEIKKGLESSVASTLKTKVKRLSGAVKPKVNKVKSPVKKGNAVAAQKKSQSSAADMLPPSEFYSKTPSKRTSKQEKEAKEEDIHKTLFKTPLAVKKQAADKPTDAVFQKPAVGKVHQTSSASSSPQFEIWKKDFSPKSLSGSPNHAYFLRSKPESYDRRLTIAAFDSLPKNSESVKKVSRNKRVNPVKSEESIDSAANEPLDDTRASKKMKGMDKQSGQKEKSIISDVETVVAREKVQLKRKSDPVDIAPRKRVKAGDLLSTSTVVPVNVESVRRLSVKLAKVKTSPGGSFVSSESQQTPISNLNSKSSPQSRGDPVQSSKALQTPAPDSSVDSTAKKRRSNVRWDTSMENVHVIESAYSNKREMRSATRQATEASKVLIDRPERVVRRSILKPDNSSSVDLADGSVHAAVEEPQAKRQLCSQICHCVILLLPIAFAAAAAVYMYEFRS